MIGKTLLYLGGASLLHAAFSAAQHKSFRRLIRESNEDEPSLPVDIVLQAILSMLLIAGVLIQQTISRARDINSAEQVSQQSRDYFVNSPSLYNFCHRGRILKPLS